MKGPGGEIKGWVEVFSYPWIDDKTGQLKGVIEYSRDITEKKKSRRGPAAERGTPARPSSILSGILSSSRTIDFRYLFVNKACLAFSGRPEEDIIGKTDFELFPPTMQPGNLEKASRPAAAENKAGPEVHDLVVNDRFLEVTKFRVDLDDGRIGIGGIVRDVTEQRLAGEKIRRSEELLRTFIDSSRDYIYLKDEQGRIILVNRAVTEFFRRGEEDIVGRTDAELFPAAQAERSDNSDRKVLEAGRALSFYEREQGQIFEVMKFPVRFADDRTGIGGIIRDITERKRAEEALRQQEAMMRSILRAAPVGIAFGRERTLQWSNEYYQRMTGYGEDDVSGRTARLLYESEEEFQRVGKALYGSIGKDGIGEAQTRWKRKDGSMIDVLLCVSPLYSDDAAAGGRHHGPRCHREKEGRRRPSGQARPGIASLPITCQSGIYEATFDGIVQYANNTALEMFGYSADEVAKGVNFLAVISPDERDTLIRHMQRIRQEGSIIYQEYTMVRKDGSRFAALNMARPLMHEGRVIGSTGVVTDISELKAAQEALRKNEALLKSILQAAPIGVGMVHDRVMEWVNEGMTAMTGYSGR